MNLRRSDCSPIPGLVNWSAVAPGHDEIRARGANRGFSAGEGKRAPAKILLTHSMVGIRQPAGAPPKPTPSVSLLLDQETAGNAKSTSKDLHSFQYGEKCF